MYLLRLHEFYMRLYGKFCWRLLVLQFQFLFNHCFAVAKSADVRELDKDINISRGVMFLTTQCPIV